MNNRLKFRAWDNQKKEWFPIKNAICLVLNPESTDLCFMTKQGPYPLPQTNQEDGGLNRFEIQQFTNAFDKLQQKIFEGDIVLFDNPDPYDGQDQLTKIVGYNSRVMGFRLYNFTHEINKYGGTVFFPEQVEVIGNIFEGAVKDGINYGEYLKENNQ